MGMAVPRGDVPFPLVHSGRSWVVWVGRLIPRERGIKSHRRWGEVHALDKRGSFRRAKLTVHTAVFPLHRKWALVVDRVQRADDLLKVDPPASQGAEIPEAAPVAKG